MSSAAAAEDDDYYNQKSTEHIKLFKPIELPPWDAYANPVSLVVESLVANNYAVIDGFIDDNEGQSLKAEVASYYGNGLMIDGEIGKGFSGGSGKVVEAMRTDKVLWLEGNEPHVKQFMRRHVTRMDIFTQKVSILLEALHPEHTWRGAGRSKIMATCYPGKDKAKYVAHYDNPNENGRKVTTILYLNESWKESHGGVLRMKTKGKTIDVAPLFNRLLVFWSDRRCPHEVLPAANVDRYAITIWFMDEDERLRAIKRAKEVGESVPDKPQYKEAGEKKGHTDPAAGAATQQAPPAAASPPKKSSNTDLD